MSDTPKRDLPRQFFYDALFGPKPATYAGPDTARRDDDAVIERADLPRGVRVTVRRADAQ